MKTINGKLSFGVKAVVSGQKTSVVNADPILIANSTAGKFTITPPVSKILGVAISATTANIIITANNSINVNPFLLI